MTEYGKLLSRIWSDPEFTTLDSRSQQLYCLLISYHSRNLAGVVPMTLKRWAKSTRDGTVDNVTGALEQLADARFIVIDWDTEEVLIRTYIRNDEVHRQPNLMKAARRFALQIESEPLRWALHTELLRLPDHRDADDTRRVANTLVETLTKPFTEGSREGLSEPFGEGIGEPPGVGVSYVTRDEHQHPQPSPTPAAAPPAIAEPPPRERSRTFTEMAGGHERPPEPDPGAATVTARRMVRELITNDIPIEIRGQLVNRAARLLDDRTDPHLVHAALELWMTKPHAGPALLGSLVAEVIKTRNGHTGKPPHKLRATHDFAADLRAQEQAQEQAQLAATSPKELT